MPAAIYFPQNAAFLRVGPECNSWHDRYRISMDVEILGDIGLIGGLDKEISDDEYRDVCRKVAEHGLRPAKVREKTGFDNIKFLPVR